LLDNSEDIRTLAILAYGKDYNANIDLRLIEFIRSVREKNERENNYC
jgi:hypothetical protein|tara:strand:+ start:198 stop:338 length:141 start_codon:yes stop_codon:yes gene_type:complete